MEKTNSQQNETIVHEGLEPLELCNDHDYITIKASKFEKLVMADALLKIVRMMYESSESYSLADRLECVFGPKPIVGDKNAK